MSHDGGGTVALPMARIRLDMLLVERGLAPSRTAAAAEIRAGRVRIGRGGQKAEKPGQTIAADERVELEEGRRYVSRGGLKLEAVLDGFDIDPGGRECLDVGASTGGFTDCLLQRGAARVIALDVGRGQLDWGLRNDERVTVIEGFNARELTASELPFAASLVVVDVSFIALAKLLAPISGAVAAGADLLAMVKPQFELGKGRVGKGGVVRAAEDRREAVRLVVEAALRLGISVCDVAPAGVPGPKGNQEFFVRLRIDGEARGREHAEDLIEQVVA